MGEFKVLLRFFVVLMLLLVIVYLVGDMFSKRYMLLLLAGVE